MELFCPNLSRRNTEKMDWIWSGEVDSPFLAFVSGHCILSSTLTVMSEFSGNLRSLPMQSQFSLVASLSTRYHWSFHSCLPLAVPLWTLEPPIDHPRSSLEAVYNRLECGEKVCQLFHCYGFNVFSIAGLTNGFSPIALKLSQNLAHAKFQGIEVGWHESWFWKWLPLLDESGKILSCDIASPPIKIQVGSLVLGSNLCRVLSFQVDNTHVCDSDVPISVLTVTLQSVGSVVDQHLGMMKLNSVDSDDTGALEVHPLENILNGQLQMCLTLQFNGMEIASPIYGHLPWKKIVNEWILYP